eukprot:gene15869-17468_t
MSTTTCQLGLRNDPPDPTCPYRGKCSTRFKLSIFYHIQDATTTQQPITTKPGTAKPPVPAICGQPEVQQSRVIAGINATKGSWPWQILMIFFGSPMCGGSIVAPNWIVTAAHCVSGYERYVRYFRVR